MDKLVDALFVVFGLALAAYAVATPGLGDIWMSFGGGLLIGWHGASLLSG